VIRRVSEEQQKRLQRISSLQPFLTFFVITDIYPARLAQSEVADPKKPS
jgi:hypothetical protein